MDISFFFMTTEHIAALRSLKSYAESHRITKQESERINRGEVVCIEKRDEHVVHLWDLDRGGGLKVMFAVDESTGVEKKLASVTIVKKGCSKFLEKFDYPPIEVVTFIGAILGFDTGCNIGNLDLGTSIIIM